MDHWRESIIPFPSAPASNIFRIAHTPRFGAGATPLSIPSLSPPPPVCIRYDVTPFVSPSPLFPHAIHLPNFADQTYVHCSQYSLPVMLSKGMNCSSVERNWWLSRGARFAIYYQQIDYLRSRRLPRLCGRVTLRKGLFDSQEEGKFVDTTSGINWDPVIIAIVIPVLEMFELILIEVNFMFWYLGGRGGNLYQDCFRCWDPGLVEIRNSWVFFVIFIVIESVWKAESGGNIRNLCK